MYYFNRKQIERLRQTVEAHEQQIKRIAAPVYQQPVLPTTYAFIGDTDGTGRYSWIGALPDENGDMTANEEYGWGDCNEDEGFARCIHNNSQWVIEDSLVLLRPALTGNYYLFDYHDVRFGVSVGQLTASVGVAEGSGQVKIPLDGSGIEWQTVNAKNPYDSVIVGNLSLSVVFGLDGYWHVMGASCEDV